MFAPFATSTPVNLYGSYVLIEDNEIFKMANCLRNRDDQRIAHIHPSLTSTMHEAWVLPNGRVTLRDPGTGPCAYVVTGGGFFMSKEAWVAHTKEMARADGSILKVCRDDLTEAINLVQHFVLIHDTDVPDFILKNWGHGKIMVNPEVVKALVENCENSAVLLPTRKGFHFTATLPDGFILAENTKTTLIQNNNDESIAKRYGFPDLHEKATEKAWELVGWEMRQWLVDTAKKTAFTPLLVAGRTEFGNS